MGISSRRLLTLIICFTLLKSSFELRFNEEINQERSMKPVSKQRAKHLMSHAENVTIDMFSGYKQRLISGEQEVTFSRRSNGDRAGRQYVSVKPYLPILDGILFGDFCSRPMYQAVANACGDVIGYKAYLASQQQQQQQQAASPTGLAPSLFTRQNYKFCEDVLSLAPSGQVTLTSSKRNDNARQCAFSIYRMNSEYMSLDCTIPSDMNGNGVFKIIGRDDKNTKGTWETVYDEYYEYFIGSVTIILLDNGDFVGNMSCAWYN